MRVELRKENYSIFRTIMWLWIGIEFSFRFNEADFNVGWSASMLLVWNNDPS